MGMSETGLSDHAVIRVVLLLMLTNDRHRAFRKISDFPQPCIFNLPGLEAHRHAAIYLPSRERGRAGRVST